MTTEERIIDSAVSIFSRKGYQNSSIKEIARKAGVNSLTVFRHFHDKETLFLQAVEKMKNSTFDAHALNQKLTYQDMEADLMTIGKAYLDEIYASLPLIRIYIGDGLNFDQLKEERWFVCPILKEHFQSYIESLEDACALAKDHSGLLAEMFVTYITRKVLPSNKYEDVWKKTSEIEVNFNESMRPQAKYMAYMISGKAANTVAVLSGK